MAGVSVLIEVQGQDKVAQRLNELLRRTDDLYPAMDDIGGFLVTSTQERFDKGETPEGLPWPPSERAEREDGKTLIDTGRLKDSQTHKATKKSVEWGTNVVYGRIHQLGGDIEKQARQSSAIFDVESGLFISRRKALRRKGGVIEQDFTIGAHKITMPKRPYLGVSKRDETEIEEIVTGYLQEAVA